MTDSGSNRAAAWSSGSACEGGRGVAPGAAPAVAPGAAPCTGRAEGARRTRWAGLLVVVVALAVALNPLSGFVGHVAAQDAIQARGIDRVCPAPPDETTQDGTTQDGTTADETTDDVEAIPVFPDLGTTHAAAVACAFEYGLLSGYPDGTFRPNEAIPRGQMATFVAAWLWVATGVSLSVPDESRFEDVEGGTHANAIEAIAAAGIVSGRSDDTFGPGEPLTRGQFTRVLAGAISYADIFEVGGPLPPEASEVTFSDTEGTTFEETISALAGIGLAAGTGEGAFEPRTAVTRGQLATFLLRAADYLDEYQRWRPTSVGEVALVAELVAVTADGTTGGDGTDPATGEEPAPSPSHGTAELSVDAFGGTLRYSLDLGAVPGPYLPDGRATLHLGDPAVGDGEVFLELADATELASTEAGILTGTVFEFSSDLRFSELLRAPGSVYVQVSTTTEPDGAVRGVLEVAPEPEPEPEPEPAPEGGTGTE